MAWNFDPDAVINSLIGVLDEMVGYRLSFLQNSDGTDTTMRSIIPDNQNGYEPPLPFITLSYEGSNDALGFNLGSGIVDVEDPDDPDETVEASYWDKFVQFGITIRCEGDDSQSILQEVRNKFIIERYRRVLQDEVYTSILMANPITRTPDLMSTQYREIGSMLLNMNTIDRITDIDTGVFETLQATSTYSRGTEDEDPIVVPVTITDT